jgi:hypothetical protein
MQEPLKNTSEIDIEIMMENVEKRRAKVSKRNAAIVSVVVHGLFIFMAFWIVAMTLPKKEEVEFVAAPPPRPRLEPRKLEMKVRVNQLTKRSSRPKLQPRMMVNAPSDMALPEIKKNPDAVKNKLQRNFSTMGVSGFGSGIGGGLGTGSGGGMGGMGLPPTIADRCSAANRSTRMRKSGGRVSSEKAVTDALAWLSIQQNADGSFGENHPVAMTGLSVLAFFGHCETPDSPLYGEVVRKAIDYLISRSGSGGSGLTTSPGGKGSSYEHGIATYALGEAYIMTGNPDYREPFLKGVQRIIKGQNTDGGWVYAMNGGSADSDTSVSGWQIQALKSAYLANLEEIAPEVEAALDKAVENLKRVYSNERRTFGYKIAAEGGENLGGVGVFAMSMWKHRKSKEVKGASEKILELTESNNRSDGSGEMDYQKMNMYGMYYNVQAMFAIGGKDWRQFNDWFQKSLSEAQNKDGSWPHTNGSSGHGGGNPAEAARDYDIYRTAMCTMMLEVYYRYLPVVDM